VQVGAVVKAGQLLAEIDPSVSSPKSRRSRATAQPAAQLPTGRRRLVLARLQSRAAESRPRKCTTTEALQSAEADAALLTGPGYAIPAQIKQTESTLRGG